MRRFGKDVKMKNDVSRSASRVPCSPTAGFAGIATPLWSQISVLAMLALIATPFTARGQFHEKHEARIAESQSVQNVKGGTVLHASIPYDTAYEGALNYLKREGYTIDSTSAETGQIVTAIDIKGGYRQTGTRVRITCIKDSDTQTSVRVLVTEQKRTKLLQTEPWNGAKANDKESAKIADAIKVALGI